MSNLISVYLFLIFGHVGTDVLEFFFPVGTCILYITVYLLYLYGQLKAYSYQFIIHQRLL